MINIKMQSGRMARIAHTGENEAVRVAFSLAPFEEAFPGGRAALLVRRKGDAQAYPAPLTVEGDTAYWTVTAADTAAAGFGQCELQWYAGDTLAKSDKFDFLVVQALEAGAEPPDAPSKRWFDAIQSQLGDLNDLTTKAKENLVAAINEAAKTGSGGAGSIDMRVSGGYIQYSTDGGTTWENLIAVADLKGEPGEDGAPGNPGEDGKPGADGYSPVAKVEETADGAKITITDKTGTTEATVKNGKDGTDGAPGADGLTPTIGDNGNWYLGTEDTGKPSRGPAGQDGAPGEKGAPGKDGAGMDITGAAAGQIAKISAVDENGVPTAWEPVDMPSGGGEKLIETKHTAICDGETAVYAFSLTGETIIGIQIIGKQEAMAAQKATIALRFDTGETYTFYPWTLNSTKYTPKNVAWILGNDKIRYMLTATSESVSYTSALRGNVMQGYSQADLDLADTSVDKITLTFDSPPVSGAKIKIVGG